MESDAAIEWTDREKRQNAEISWVFDDLVTRGVALSYPMTRRAI